MLKARLLDQFKGSERALLIWGDPDGMRALKDGLSRLPGGEREVHFGEVEDKLTVCMVDRSSGHSRVRVEKDLLRWECSIDTLELAASLIEPLLRGGGHQYLDATDEAEQVVLSAGEYPADLR